MTTAPTLTFLGAAETVTGSRYLLETSSTRVAIDSGLFQGTKDLRLRNWADSGLDAAHLDAVVVTHAHLDHCGYLPVLVKEGFRGPILLTPDTARLAKIVLADAGRLNEEDAEHHNEVGSSKHRPAKALFTEAEAMEAAAQFRPTEFGQSFEVGDLTFEFQFAGHILGSASVRVTLPNDEVIVFSGDLGRTDHPLLDPPRPIGRADWIVTESTYGDRLHESDVADRFDEAIRRGIARGGAIVIPSFAVDRTEVVLFHLARLAKQGDLDGVPVVVDSPMALDALRVYRDAMRSDRGDIRDGITASVFDIPDLRESRTTDDSKRIDTKVGAQIIVSASGMATGGRVLHHLLRFLPERDCTVLLVGYQVSGTRGRALADGATSLKMFGRYVSVRAHIETIHGLSVHADQKGLLDWLATAEGTPECVFCTHGEKDSVHVLAQLVAQRNDWTTGVPGQGDRVLLERLRRPRA